MHQRWFKKMPWLPNVDSIDDGPCILIVPVTLDSLILMRSVAHNNKTNWGECLQGRAYEGVFALWIYQSSECLGDMWHRMVIWTCYACHADQHMSHGCGALPECQAGPFTSVCWYIYIGLVQTVTTSVQSCFKGLANVCVVAPWCCNVTQNACYTREACLS